jgi:uncharacterized membrane protein HdeD (DUF308 family)
MERLDLSSEEAREAARVWWAILIVGLLSAIAGIIVVLKPSHSLATLAVVVGIFLLIDGILELFRSFGPGENRALAAVVGVLGIIVGIALIRHPFHGVNAIGLLIGIWLVAAGVIRFVRALAERQRLVVQTLVALLEVLVGIAIVSDPHIGYTALAIVVGIWLILNGIGMIAAAVALRRITRER